MDLYQLFVQSLVIIAVLIFSLSFHAKDRRGILLYQLIGITFWLIHYYLLGAWTGVGLTVLNVVIVICSLFKHEKKWIDTRMFLSVVILVIAGVTLLTWQGYFSIFAFLGLLSLTLAKWQDNPNTMRAVSIPAGICWIIYDIFVGSYGGIISETVIMLSALASLINDKKNRK